MKLSIFFLVIFLIFSCKNKTSDSVNTEESTTDISAISTKDFRKFKVLNSKYIDVDKLWSVFSKDLKDFTEDIYNNLKPLILEQDIPTLQKHITEGLLTYEMLTKFYLYRIRMFDRENDLSLNSVISINPNVIDQARYLDKVDDYDSKSIHPIYGMPILLKDNINASGMPTTAGSVALKDNNTSDAFIVKQLIRQGALILGKANLSEWAYFFCGNCPSGYSAIGGQTLNPYGRRAIDTGGSSSGSGVAVAANFCVAAIGSETSGSILSPASKNSVVGLKPTIGMLSRSGIVPISSTLDTAGPITKNVTDNAILLDAIFGEDKADSKSIATNQSLRYYYKDFSFDALKGKRFGAIKRLLEDSLYVSAIAVLKSQGAEIVEFEEEEIKLENFIRLLNLDMKADLPKYFSNYADASIDLKSVQDVIQFNLKDSVKKMPYGQKLFKGIVTDSSTEEEFQVLKDLLKTSGRLYFDIPMKAHQLDAILSINNYHASFAAVAEYPALTIPMGYDTEGVPKGLTFISTPFSEKQLLEWAYAYEQASKMRQTPKDYN